MTGETESLVLDLLRGLRADIAAIGERLDAIDTQREGWRTVFVATTGSLVTDMKDHDTRIAALEGTRA